MRDAQYEYYRLYKTRSWLASRSTLTSSTEQSAIAKTGSERRTLFITVDWTTRWRDDGPAVLYRQSRTGCRIQI